MAAALESLYKRHSAPSDFVPEELFHGIVKTLNFALSDDLNDDYPKLSELIRENNEVFAAFKVHDQCSRMAQLLTDSDGNIRSFDDWKRDAEPIASHHNKVWLRTEYDTAVKRAEQARQWKQFEEERDVLPNLRWVPSTAVTPGEDHRKFWDTVLPIDDPFWSQHKPGDRWGCQCSLEATDEPETGRPEGGPNDEPAPGLDNNPAKDGKLFSDSHPFYPDNCAICPFNTGGIAPSGPANKLKDCNTCQYLRSCLPINNQPSFTKINVGNGLSYKISDLIDKKSVDYDDLKKVAEELVKAGFNDVTLTPKMPRPATFDYDCYYSELRGTKYEGKCPDIRANGVFYELEGFNTSNHKRAFKNMCNRGLMQSSRIIIMDCGLTDRYMKRSIFNMIEKGAIIDEVWVKSNGGLRRLLL